MDDSVRKALSGLERQCARREYCSYDIYRKALVKLDGNADAAEEVLKSLLDGGYVDDSRYAAAFARDKAFLGGWGRYKIRQALLAKHVDEESIAAALDDVDPEKAAERLDRLMETKWKSLQGDPQAKLKLMKFALSRGYDYSEIRRFLDGI
ncbi:MAG: RecX family transcriptional regulator [Bacteroidales bacterium]|nr:RecX family transcriptional regulator [Bacteroidales bacterium]